jgi:hypothetical protein
LIRELRPRRVEGILLPLVHSFLNPREVAQTTRKLINQNQ